MFGQGEDVTCDGMNSEDRCLYEERLRGFVTAPRKMFGRGFEKHDRIIRLDRSDQESFRVIGVGRHEHFDTTQVREDALGALGVCLPTADATASLCLEANLLTSLSVWESRALRPGEGMRAPALPGRLQVVRF